MPADVGNVRPSGSFVLDRLVPAIFVLLVLAMLAIIIAGVAIFFGIVETR